MDGWRRKFSIDDFMRRCGAWLPLLSLAAAGAGLVYALARFCFEVRAVSGVYYDAATGALGDAARLCIMLGGAVAAVFCTLPWRKGWRSRLDEGEKILRPALLLWLIPCTCFPGVLLAILVIGWVAFLAGKHFRFRIPALSDRCGLLIAVAGGIALAAWGYFLQVHAFDTHYFIWGDWNQYAEHYQHLLSGNARLVQWFSGGGHWNFAVNVIMCGALKLRYVPDMIFVIHALCIASVVPLGYWLSRKCGLSAWFGVLWLPLTALNPVLSNQYLSLFYGFHPIVFFIPLLMGFFIAREYGCRRMMAVMFFLSLLVQETVCVFWAGYALWLLCRGKWRTAIPLFVGMVVIFVLIGSVVIPAAHDAENYAQMFHYAQLGGSMGEVLLSPVLRPKAFWGTVFDRGSLCFTLGVFVPVFFGVMFRPLMLVTLLPVFAGVILQNSPEVKTVMLQYGLECTLFSMIVMTLNWKTLAPELRRASAFAVLTATCLCGWMLGMVPGGKGPLKQVMDRPSAADLVDFFNRAAGRSERIIATGRMRGQFQFIRPTASVKSGYRPGDAVILDLHDGMIENEAEVLALRRKLVADRRAVPVTYAIRGNHTMVMFRILPQEVGIPGVPWLRQMPEELFARCGRLVHREKDDYELRYVRLEGRHIYLCRLCRALDHDLEFTVIQREGERKQTEAVVLFGNGLFPAYSVPPGTVFEFAIPGEGVTEISAFVRKRGAEEGE